MAVSSSAKKPFRTGWFIVIPCVLACIFLAYQFLPSKKRQQAFTTLANIGKPIAVQKDSAVPHPVFVQTTTVAKTAYHRPNAKKYHIRQHAKLIMEKDLYKKTKPLIDSAANNDKDVLAELNSLDLLDSFYRSIAKQPVMFRIQPQQDTILHLPEGTIIAISANTFVYTDGRPVNEPVVFSVTEFYDKKSMICNRLSTSSGGQPLVTGGMLQLTAKDATGNELVIKQNGSIDVQMPAKNMDKQMQLFLPVKNATPAYNKKDSIFQMLELLDWIGFGQMQANMPVPMVNVIDWTETTEHFAGFSIRFENSPMKFLINSNCELTNQEVKKKLENQFPGHKIIVRRQWKHPIKFLTQDDPATIGEKKWLTLAKAKKYKLVTPQEEQGSLKQFQENLKQYKNDSIRLAATAQIKNNYGFKVTTLGFINCDRFYGDPRPKVSYAINQGNSSERYYVHRLFLHTINSIMAVSDGYFKNIPAGEKVTLVSVGIINNETVASFKTFTTEKSGRLFLEYQPTEPGMFKNALQSVLDNNER